MRLVIMILALALELGVSATASAQGVNDPSTPNARVIIVNPPAQPSRPTATTNIPPASVAPSLGVNPIYPGGYRSGARTRSRQ